MPPKIRSKIIFTTETPHESCSLCSHAAKALYNLALSLWLLPLLLVSCPKWITVEFILNTDAAKNDMLRSSQAGVQLVRKSLKQFWTIQWQPFLPPEFWIMPKVSVARDHRASSHMPHAVSLLPPNSAMEQLHFPLAAL